MSYKLGLSRDQYGFTNDHDVVDHFERMSDAVNSNGESLALLSGLSGVSIDTDPTLAADSDTLVASQKATKEYVDTVALNVGTKVTVVDGGAFTATATIPGTPDNGDTVIVHYQYNPGVNMRIIAPATGTFTGMVMREQAGVAGMAGFRNVAGGGDLINLGTATANKVTVICTRVS